MKNVTAIKDTAKEQCEKWKSYSNTLDFLYRMIDFGRLKGVEWKEYKTSGLRVLADKTAGLGQIILTFEPESLEFEMSTGRYKTGQVAIMLASSRVESMDSLIAAFRKLKNLAQ